MPGTWTSLLAEKEKITEGSSPFRPVIEAEQNCLSSHHFLSFSSYISPSPSLSLRHWHWLAHCSPAVNNWCLREAESIGYQYCSEPHRANVQFGKSVTKCGKECSDMLEYMYCITWSNSASHCGACHPQRERLRRVSEAVFSLPTTVIHWNPLLNTPLPFSLIINLSV